MEAQPAAILTAMVYDAIVVGAGPNGLSAAVTLAAAGASVLVVEGADEVGGGARTRQLTLPGFHHDVCSAIHPLAAGSPFLRTLPLADHGLEWVHPPVALAHAFEDEEAVLVHRSITETAAGLGEDGPAYRRILDRMTADWPDLEDHVLGPLLRIPRHPVALARFGLDAAPPAALAARRFSTRRARGLFAGCAAHAFLPLNRPFTASFGWLLLTLAHTHGWPLARGGSGEIANALASHLTSIGGEIETGHPVTDLGELPPSRLVLLDVTPSGFARLAGDRLPSGYVRRARRFRHGPGAFKVDLALDGPIPWRDPRLAEAGTVHIGGAFREVAASEADAWSGRISRTPFTLVAQPSAFDPTRAPAGGHTVWAYAHVPAGSPADMGPVIEERIEAMAPGFRDRILARHAIGPPDWEEYNPNYVGGDISGGAHTATQLLFRPFPQADPYATPLDGVFLCSSSTPPGAGVHGMSGHHAALRALRHLDGRVKPIDAAAPGAR